jgi:putative PIN family toxin of toxin-antitoxin system
VRRAVVDTNVWVSAVLSPTGAPAQVLEALEDRRFELIISEWLLAELDAVLARPRIARRYNLASDVTQTLIRRLRSSSTIVRPSGDLYLCRDPADDLVIETAVVGNADTLVSRDDDLKGDADLIQLLHVAGVEILTVRRFLAALDEDPADR